ncbi:YggS family pyridoxal phosphate enzyme [Limnohabitans sp. Jir61]|uniref:YggS family pyridoxal phosphate-dependent enzyme n=1 Tax=Limnohabitans sp. Jir61 TaxID=1826168 RepID=UPI000D36DC40|nr:YggS family pyridoxal phosphate-dependent enzyme [Limnohabitans sp. Jir61]PUE31266.1 YggS family pyridoxal phosphate enzyme [Limnohabitans sp. Jir61]
MSNTDTAFSNTLRDKLHAVQARITAACVASGRAADSVQLLAVSKTFSADDVCQVAASGQRDFGENYIQEGVDKITALQDSQPALVWHCIGPMQSNKTKLVAEHFDWAHTVDRLKIAQRLSDQRPAHLAPLNVCLQVNIDGGETKSGIAPADVLALAAEVAKLPRLVLRGLMTIPDPVDGFDAQVAVHAKARALFDEVKTALNLPRFDTLSMGMTGDLEAAVQAGSTMVRVGTAIFGGRDYSK